MRKWLAAFGLVVLALAIAVGAKTLATRARRADAVAESPKL